MTVALTSPVTGGAQTGFTTPAWVLTVDTPRNLNSKMWAVTSGTGTITGVDFNSASSPFKIEVSRPVALRAVPPANAITGIIANSIPVNEYRVTVWKGARPAANNVAITAQTVVTMRIPAGTDTYEPEDIRAMISLVVGALNQVSAGLGDTVVSGVL